MHLFSIGYPWKACLGFTIQGRRVALNFLPFGAYLKDNLMDVYFPQNGLQEVGHFYYDKEKNNLGFTLKLKKRWEEIEVKNLQKNINKIEKIELANLKDKQLLKIFNEFSGIYISFWREAIFLDSFDVISESILDEALEEENKNIKKDNLAILTSVEELSWAQKERKEFIELIFSVKRDRKLLKFLRSNLENLENNIPDLFPDFLNQLQDHANKYHWMYNDYAIIKNLDWKFFFKNIIELLRDKKLLEKEKRAIDFALRTKEYKRNIFKKLKFSSRFINIINFLTILVSWRDSRKAYSQMANRALSRFTEEFRKRMGLGKREVEYFWWWEIKDFLDNKKDTRKLYKKRKNGMFCVGDPTKSIFYGKEAKEVQSFMTQLLSSKKDLTGRAVFGGIVRGKAKIILSQKDFYKMETGDIIIASNTRPEYVPIMKIAGALVSEEGGLTCHTAIVARELKIPAIVGVQGAIATLKDGDLVEVDAKKGVVKILKRKI